MITSNKYAVLHINVTRDPEGLPVKKTSEVIKQLKSEGYTVNIIREK